MPVIIRDKLIPLFAALVVVIMAFFHPMAFSANNEAFIVELKTEPKTIGDIKPNFIVYKDKELPKVTINAVLKRYIKLFESANSPDVKIDALNRINNLRAKYKLGSKKLTIDSVEQSKVVLDSYDRIVDSGVFYQRMDELLYQTAKATKFVGNEEESIRRLKMLVGLYPKSELVDEGMFRMAESYFEIGQFAKAEAAYKKLLAFSEKDLFHEKSKFKIAWSAFRLDKYQDAGKFAMDVLAKYPQLVGKIEYSYLTEWDYEFVDDTFRLLSIIFSKQEGAKNIEDLQDIVGHKNYSYLLYDSLFRLYLKQDRYQDSAEVARDYTTAYPADFYAYKMGLNSILSYRKGEFDILEWGAKEHFVSQFGIKTKYWEYLSKVQKDIVKPLLIENLKELAHSSFVKMQDAIKRNKAVKKKDRNRVVLVKDTTDFKKHGIQAADYYLELVATNTASMGNPRNLYLAAEALKHAGQLNRAIGIYERAAYEQVDLVSSVKAGYAAILAYDIVSKNDYVASSEVGNQPLGRRASIIKFTSNFPFETQTPALLNDLANDLFVEEEYLQAANYSKQVLAHKLASSAVKRSSWLVYAHSNFELKKFRSAEQAYLEILSQKKGYDEVLSERLAASIYKQAEAESDISRSAELYLRVADVVPESKFVPQALFDASTRFMETKKWRRAIATLNSFQQQFPLHELYSSASDKLIFSYLENGESVSAAEKLVQVSNDTSNAELASNSLYRAAEIYRDNDLKLEGVELFTAFTEKFPTLVDLNIEARQFNIDYFDEANQKKQAIKWRKSMISYHEKYWSERNSRSSYLAANASLSLILLDLNKFDALKLTLPLKSSLARKTKSLKELIAKFETLSKYQVAEIQSASTFHIGRIYKNLAQDLMQSERPKGLSPLELEQYDILLEEEAYPFEEQAFEIFGINTAKVPEGYFDDWVSKTYEVLSEMNPTEFQRNTKELKYAEDQF